ncbi:hypothetical protein O0L34_g560 [Tuta absoluta]|nr:hypothetical protein O0L34_g560 [Tuta absoluta]
MASSIAIAQDTFSNENSLSTKEFLDFEKTCGAYKDSDEEIKMLFSEITKLSATMKKDSVIGADVDDVDLILKRAEDIANETENILKSPSMSTITAIPRDTISIPQIKVTKPMDNKENEEKASSSLKVRIYDVFF